MADFTKRAIRASFVKLLNEKPLKQITVKDIVDDCGVNRNTFYYHYQDISHLLESMVQEETDQLIEKYPTISSLDECLEAIISFALENKRAVMHIYRSVNRDLYEKSQWRVCEHTVNTYLDAIMEDRRISAADRRLIKEYMKSVCFGIVNNWLETGMQDDIRAMAARLCLLKEGQLEEILDRCETK